VWWGAAGDVNVLLAGANVSLAPSHPHFPLFFRHAYFVDPPVRSRSPSLALSNRLSSTRDLDQLSNMLPALQNPRIHAVKGVVCDRRLAIPIIVVLSASI
jgi:hypothetical protein